ncbi:hypothetical protein H5410_000629 [Solanum commersonii]|uniref:Uncharacterized protein n=1 Tax=Solanum commersonii TaxID=4109 RepID=A0A9J6AWR4_SOLCO|nr:hypothetical protein H5410_000629 [Solanum commersonii]
MNSQISKKRESLGTSKPKHLDFGVTEMDTCVTSQEMQMYSILKDTSTIEVLQDVNQDNRSGAYDNTARFQYYESANCKQSHHQDTSFKCENVEEANANGTIERAMHLAKMKKKASVNIFEKSDEKEEDELRKRIEDFIEKINRGWREEKLRVCYQSQ